MDITVLDKTEHMRKTAHKDRELTRPRINIADIQETRLAYFVSTREGNYTCFWKAKGLGDDERAIHGIGFTVHNELLNKISTPRYISERITIVELVTKAG